MKRLSPVSSRLPAPSSAPMMPGLACWLPSPNTVSIWMPGVMYISAPASATALSPGSSSTSTNCMSSPMILKSMSCARRPVAAPSGGGPAGAGFRCGGKLRDRAERRPVRHARREHQRIRVDAAVDEIRSDLVLARRDPPGAPRLPCTTGLPLTCSCEEIERSAPRAAVGLGSRAATPSAVGRYDGCSAAPGPWAAAAAVIRSTAARSSSAAAAGSRPS